VDLWSVTVRGICTIATILRHVTKHRSVLIIVTLKAREIFIDLMLIKTVLLVKTTNKFNENFGLLN